jgi:hypothetical protein
MEIRSTRPHALHCLQQIGGTTEPNVMKDYFFDRVSRTIGKDKAGHRFIAVTDPGSSLEKGAIKQGFAASSMAIPRSADAIPCCRRSAWCRRPPPVSTFAA